MAVVLKSKNGGAKKSPISSWLGYGAVAVFGLAIISTAFMGGGKAPDPMDASYSYSDYKDLADMPFSNEAAEAELLSSVRYGDIAKNDLINALFSQEDKENRQAEDALNGVPAPPDEDYAQAAADKERVKKAKEVYRMRKQEAGKLSASRTSKGSLSSSSGVRVSGGGSGVSATIWRADDKRNNLTSSSGGGGASAPLSGQFANDIKNIGRGGGFMQAYDKSRAAANTADLEAAHELAADAFQNAGDLGENLKGDAEKLAEDLNLDKLMGEVDKNKKRMGNDLDEKLSEAKDKAENKDKPEYKCDGPLLNGEVDISCVMSGALQSLLEGGKNLLTSLWNGRSEKSAERAAILKDTQNEISDVEEKINSLNSESAKKKGEIASLNDEIKNLSSGADNAEKNSERIASLNEKINTLSSESAKISEEITSLKNEKRGLEKKAAYFSGNDSTSKGWKKFSNKSSESKAETKSES